VDGKHKVIKDAPVLNPIPPSIDLVASMVRNASKSVEETMYQKIGKIVEERCGALQKEHNELHAKYLEISGGERVLERYNSLKAKAEKFKLDTGIDIIGSDWSCGKVPPAEVVKLSTKLLGWKGVSVLRDKLKGLYDDLEELDRRELEAAGSVAGMGER